LANHILEASRVNLSEVAGDVMVYSALQTAARNGRLNFVQCEQPDDSQRFAAGASWAARFDSSLRLAE